MGWTPPWTEMRYDRLVAPAVSLFAVLALLIGARTYENWPIKPLPCSLRTLTGIPCIGCGGTRTMEALSRGEIVEAAQFSPLVVLGVFAVLIWFAWTVATMKMHRYQREWVAEKNEQSGKKRGWRWGVLVTVLVLINWVYLVCYLPL